MSISYADFLAMQARCNPKAKKPAPSEGCNNEAALHDLILSWCRSQYPQWVALHGRMDMASGRTLGEPDFILLAPGGRLLLVECKTRTGKLTTEQLGIAHQATLLGHTVHVVRSFDQFLTLTETI